MDFITLFQFVPWILILHGVWLLIKNGGDGANTFTLIRKNLADTKKTNAETLKIIAETKKINIEVEKALLELQMLKSSALRPTAEEIKKFLPVILVAIYLASIAAHGVVPGIPAIGLFLCLVVLIYEFGERSVLLHNQRHSTNPDHQRSPWGLLFLLPDCPRWVLRPAESSDLSQNI